MQLLLDIKSMSTSKLPPKQTFPWSCISYQEWRWSDCSILFTGKSCMPSQHGGKHAWSKWECEV